MTRRVLLTIVLAQAICLAQKTDFSGTWKLNKAKSNFGNLPENLIPEDATRTITNTDSEMKVSAVDKSARGERTTNLVLTLDGSPSVNSQRGADVTTIAVWDGSTVLAKSKIDVGGSALDMEERYSVSTDRQLLTVEAKVAGTPIGDIVVKYAFEKSQAAGLNLSGNWKLNVAKSNFGGLPDEYRPISGTRVISHTASQISMEIDQTTGQGSLKSVMKLKLDGTESVNEVPGGQIKSVAKLAERQLEVVSQRPFGDLTLNINEKTSLAENGQNLVVDTQIAGTPLGVIVTQFVFEKN
jgi:hypothetical protein